jgi:hypothetical protein
VVGFTDRGGAFHPSHLKLLPFMPIILIEVRRL